MKRGMLIDDIRDPASALEWLEGHAKLEEQRQANQRAREIRKCISILKAALKIP